MLCNISKREPHEPVVSRVCGCLFERRLIEQYIDEYSRCPITGNALQRDDLLPVHCASLADATALSLSLLPSSATTAKRADGGGADTAAATTVTVPALLHRLHGEWDALMLEQFALRQRVAQLEQELAHALERYEAACRVIATLDRAPGTHAGDKDVDDSDDTNGRVAQQHASNNDDDNNNDDDDDDDDDDAVVLPDELADAVDTHEAAARAQRKQRKRERDAAGDGDGSSSAASPVRELVVAQSFRVEHAATAAAAHEATTATEASVPAMALCVASSSSSSHSATLFAAGSGGDGGGGAVLVRYDLRRRRVTAIGVGHAGPVVGLTADVDCHRHTRATTATAASDGVVAVSAAADHTMRVWRAKATSRRHSSSNDSSNNNNNNNDDNKNKNDDADDENDEVLWCSQTLRCADGVSALASRTIAGRYVLAGGGGGTVYIADVERGAHVVVTPPSALLLSTSSSSRQQREDARVCALELHPYTSLAALATRDGVVTLCDVRRMRADTRVLMPSSNSSSSSSAGVTTTTRAGYAHSLSFSLDCVTLATGLSDGRALLWDLRALTQPLATWAADTPVTPAIVAFDDNNSSSSKARVAVACGARVRVYSTTHLHDNNNNDGAVGHDSSSNRALLATTTTTRPDDVHAGVHGLCWTSDASAVAAAALDGVVRVYNVS